MSYRDTRIYQRALSLVGLTKEVLDHLPSGFGFLSDQLRRASSSVLLNFAEGCGKSSLAEQRRYFQIAKASAYEVLAALDVAAQYGVIRADRYAKGADLCDHIAAMLSRFRC
jgi:four helix bundle protein